MGSRPRADTAPNHGHPKRGLRAALRAAVLPTLTAVALSGCALEMVELVPDYSSVPILVDDTLTFTTIGSGHLHTCAVGAAGTHCWGYNEYGQLGTLQAMDRCLGEMPCTGDPQLVTGAPDLVWVGGGVRNTCGLASSGDAYCWGGGDSLAGIVVADTVPTKVPGGVTFEHLSMQAIADATCGIATDGLLHCWGWGWWSLRWIDSDAPVPFETEHAFTTVTIAQNHICALATDGKAFCWGSNWSGQLGLGWYGQDVAHATDTPDAPFDEPQAVLGDHTFVQLVATASSTCGLTAAGEVYCWGLLLETTRSNVPVRVATSIAFQELFGGTNHVCALTPAGAGYCWGHNEHGKLGDGTRQERATPEAVAGGHTFTTLSASSTHTCGLASDARAYCWGTNNVGQLGRPGREAQPGSWWW
jgi:alpha-tubulin suppressor-like RCC1 family protein